MCDAALEQAVRKLCSAEHQERNEGKNLKKLNKWNEKEIQKDVTVNRK
jgi:hypothetical protein